jgi:predicted glycosyltransferase
MLDYEHVRGFVHPSWLITPEICPDKAFAHVTKRILKYPGLKEDVYVPNFKPDPSTLTNLGINREELVIVIRPPATEAHYHNPKSEQLFEATVNHVGRQQGVKMVILPRNFTQTALIKRKWPDLCADRKIVIPEHVVDGLNLIWYSDLVISGGGTMNREAAALGVPVYSIFRGKIGAVDQWLSQENRLTLIENEEELYSKLALTRRHRADFPDYSNNPTLQKIVSYIIGIAEADGH